MFSLATAHMATNAYTISIPAWIIATSPYMYQSTIAYDAISVIPRAAFRLNNRSVDGILLYRCYMFYSGNLWVIAFPCLMYLASERSRSDWVSGWDSGLYKTVTTMHIESSALFAVSSVLVIGVMAVDSPLTNTFSPALAETSLPSLLIIQRVASKSALTSDVIISGSTSLLKARTRGELTDFSDDFPGECPEDSTGKCGMNSNELGVAVETTIDLHRGRV